MNKKEVKVFDAYDIDEKDKQYYYDLGLNDYYLMEYHNCILRKNGTIKPTGSFTKHLKPIKPLDKNLVTKIKWELDSIEKETLSMLKSSVKKTKDLYDSCERKYNRYERLLIDSLPIEEDLYDGDEWDCELSPIGKCIYKIDSSGESVCVFCGEPEERK